MKKLRMKWVTAVAMFILSFSTVAQTTEIKGLTVVVEFPDAPFQNSLDSVSMMMNQPGYTGWGNEGSVRDYYYNQSAGKVLITSTVIKVSLDDSVNHYYGDGATGSDISDIVDKIVEKYPDGFTDLTIDSNGNVRHFNVLCKAGVGAWAFGQQPGNTTIKNNGQDVNISSGNITTYGRNQDPQISTVCHEMGHNIMGWGDYYNASEVDGASNLGHYCVMGSGGTAINPSPVSAPFRYKNGWIDTIVDISNTTTTYTVTSNSRTKVFKYTNSANPHEYFLIESLHSSGYYHSIDGNGYAFDEGLAVWYVDEERGKFNPSTLPDAPTVKLIQADGMDEMHDITKSHRDHRGDLTDLFDNLFNTLSAANHPFFRWKDGSEPGLIITNISAPGSTMQFTVQARPNTISSQLQYSNGGTISPRGLISYDGTSTTFSIVPEIGYEVSDVVVDGVSVGSITSHTFNTSGDHTISATFAQSSTADSLPSPWQEAQIGNTRQPGVAGYRNGTFGLESSSYDIWGTQDGLSFIYQPMTGDGEIVGQITSMNNPTGWAKAGLMMRETLDPGSKHFMLVKTPSNNYAPQMRVQTDGGSEHNPQGTRMEGVYFKYPWIKLVRSGNTFSSYISLNGTTNWKLLATKTIAMNQTIFVGMCAGAGSDQIGTKATFSDITVTTPNTPPTVSITSPANNASFAAPASVTVTASASDADGSVSKVEFFQGSTLVATDYSAPYSCTISGLSAGSYNITAKATDDEGAYSSSSVSIDVVNSSADIIGPACTSANTTETFELSSANRANATSYNWWYTGSADNITPVSGTAYKANLNTGSNFSAGEVCVGVNYSASPWYASYCEPVADCSSARMGLASEANDTRAQPVSYPNPFRTETTISIPARQPAKIQVFNTKGVLIHEDKASGEYRLGNSFKSGMYLLMIDINGTRKTITLIKE